MRAGKFDRRIVIQSHTDTVDGYGQPVSAWTNFSTVWASMVPLKGKEYIDADAVTAESTFRIFTRYRNDITRDMRISYKSEIYEIEHIAEIDRKKGLEIVARVVRDDG